MASERQIAANRANAALSTGPKSAAGKQRSSRNALKHGLSKPILQPFAVCEDHSPSASCERESTDCFQVELAQIQTRLSRIRCIRAELIAAVLLTPNADLIKRLSKLGRYEREAWTKRRNAITDAHSLRSPDKANPI